MSNVCSIGREERGFIVEYLSILVNSSRNYKVPYSNQHFAKEM